MKKYLLLLLTMLSVSIGTWADPTIYNFGTDDGSSASIDGTSITIHVNNAGEFASWVGTLKGETTPALATVQACTNVTFTGTLNDADLGAINNLATTGGTMDLSAVTIASGSSFSSFVLNNTSSTYYVTVPSSVNITNKFLNDAYKNMMAIGVNGTTTSIYLEQTTNTESKFNSTNLAHVPADTKVVVVYTSQYGNEGNYRTSEDNKYFILNNADLESLSKSNFTSATSTIEALDLSNIASWAESDYLTHFVNYDNKSVSSSWKYVLSPIGKLTVSGTVTASDIAFIKSNFSSSYIDFSGATFNPSISILEANSATKGITLPKGTVLDDALKARLQGMCGNLDYIYSPSSDADRSSTTPHVADYVYVAKAGGLKQAFVNEPELRECVYLKVESAVALNADDVKISDYGVTTNHFEYIDLSGANITPAIATNWKVPDSYSASYRIIAPDGWTADEMASFSKGPRLGGLAAVYSYSGKTLNVEVVNSNTYASGALRESRIVRSDTEGLIFVRGTYEGTSCGSFGSNVLDAINNAQASIKSVKIATQDGVAGLALTFTNTSLERIDLSNLFTGENERGAAIDVKICTNLQNVDLGNSKFISFDATGCSNLSAINMVGTDLSGNFTLNNSGITRITIDTNVGGNITATGCTALTRISNTGTIGGNIEANGDSGTPLSTLTTFINNGTITGDVNLSYTGINSFTNNGTVKSINLSHCDNSSFTSFAIGGTVNGDIDLTDCTNLTSINVANATINNQGTYNTGYTVDVNFTRGGQSDTSNTVYDNLKDGSGRYNVTKATSGQESLTFAPSVTPKTADATSTSVAGVISDNCALTVGLTNDLNKSLTTLLKEYYHLQHPDVAVENVTLAQLGTLSICNLTVTTSGSQTLSSTDIATINALTFGSSTGSGIVWRDATLNLDAATLASDVSLATNTNKITNTTVNNIILPRNLDKDVVNATNFGSCTNLNAAVSLNAARTQVVGYVKKPGMLRQTLSQVPDLQRNPWQYMQNLNLPSVTLTGTLLACDIATGNDHVISNGNYKESPTSAEKLTGYDACGTGGKGLAFEGVNTLRNLDIADAIFVDGSDNTNIMEENMTLSQLGWAGIVSLKMPKSDQMKDVPARFLRNCQQIRYLCIPYNYETIGDEAFYLAGTNWITTTDSKGVEIDNGINTYTFSKNLKQIGTDPGTYGSTNYPGVPEYPVFAAVTSAEIHDIYILRNGYEDYATLGFYPTKCWRGAFTSGMTYGWGGFDGGNIYCREKFKNGAFLFTILNYPDNASLPSKYQYTTISGEGASDVTYGNTEYYDQMEKAYTDVTKVYTKKDQTGAVDANGDLIPWPTFSELGRAYNQAIRGLIWNDWNIIEEKQREGNVNGGTIIFDPETLPAETNEVDSPDHTQFHDYVGWHEFVLSKATYVAPDENVVDNKIYRGYQEPQFYTFCVPFDMTPAEVLNLLGVPASDDDKNIVTTLTTLTYDGEGNVTNEVVEKNTTDLYPEIYTLKSVVRTLATSSDPNKIRLGLSKNLAKTEGGVYQYWMPADDCTGEYTSNAITRAEDDVEVAGSNVMIRGGYPYLIKAYLPQGAKAQNGSLGRYILSRYTFPMTASSAVVRRPGTFIGLHGKTYTSYFARPYDQHLVRALQADPNSSNSTPATKDGVKPYNYRFLGEYWQQWMPTNTYYLYPREHKWYYNKNVTNWKWAPYVCIINADDQSYVNPDTGEYTAEDLAAAIANGSVIPYSTVDDSEGHAVFTENLKLHYSTTPIDDTVFPTAGAREFYFVFDDNDIVEVGDDNVTAIESINGVDIRPVTGKVYNMAGQYVGNSLEGLSKGMYIVNGKKIVVK